jgi:ABC-type branched-subunit amino acid transport system substrate-binding protein
LISVAAFSWDNCSSSESEKNYSLSKSSYENSFAVALSIQHLNQGDGTIVDAVNGLNETCNMKFVTEFIDTQSDAVTAAKMVSKRILQTQENDSTYEYDPCGFLGATASGAETEQISVVTNTLGYPMVSGISLDTSLDHESNYPKFARTIPSNEGPAKAFVKYVVEKLDSEFLVILNYDDLYTNDLANRYVPVNEAEAVK